MITLNKDRKQTKYGHKRQEHMTHTTEPWHNSPFPEGGSHVVTVPRERGGGCSEGPSGQTRTGPQDGDLQSRTDDGGHGGAGSSGGHGRWSSSRNLSTPPKKFPGVVRGYQEPSGARQIGQHMTGQESPPGPDRQDKTSHRKRKPSWASKEAEASSGHDKTSGAPQRFPELPLPLPRQGGRRLEWPPRPQQEEPPAPDESPWTRPTR